MANIRIDLPIPAFDGQTVTFKAPCHASNVTGLNIYTTVDGVESCTTYTLADAHGNDVGDIDELFATGAVVKVVLDTEERKAFVQNPDTNAYLEAKFAERNIKTFTTLAQIAAYAGVEVSTLTSLKSVVKAMPHGSILLSDTSLGGDDFDFSDVNGNGLQFHGVLEIFKDNNTRNYIRLLRCTTSATDTRVGLTHYVNTPDIIAPWIFQDWTTGYLPLSGGEINGKLVVDSGTETSTITIQRTLSNVPHELSLYPTGSMLNGATAGYLLFKRDGANAAAISFNETGVALVDLFNGKYYPILHTNNLTLPANADHEKNQVRNIQLGTADTPTTPLTNGSIYLQYK